MKRPGQYRCENPYNDLLADHRAVDANPERFRGHDQTADVVLQGIEAIGQLIFYASFYEDGFENVPMDSLGWALRLMAQQAAGIYTLAANADFAIAERLAKANAARVLELEQQIADRDAMLADLQKKSSKAKGAIA